MSDKKEDPVGTSQPAPSETPEVEAEIVTDEDLVDAAADTGEGFVDAHEKTSPPRKSTLTPGVIFFILFAIITLTVFAVWRFQPGKTAPALEVATNPAPEIVEEVVETVPNPGPPSVEMPDALEPPAPIEQAMPIGKSKILNDVDETKIDDRPVEALESIDAVPQFPNVLDESAIAGNLELLADAKAAVLDERSDVEDAADATTAEFARTVEDIPALELDPLKDEAIELDAAAAIEEDDVAVEDVAPVEEVATEAQPVLDEGEPKNILTEETEQDTQKINNDFQSVKDSFREEIAGLEAALAEEREQGVAQRAQIEEMQRNFQAALAARDRTANQQIAALNARLDKIENGSAVEGGRRAAAALALNALRRVAENGEPFANELEVLTGYIPQGQEIATLRRYADVEIPLVAELASEFSTSAREALSASPADESANFVGKLSARAGSLISIRPAEPVAGDSVGAVISRAEAFIDAGDIVACVAELGALEDEPRAAMAGWVTNAQSRVAVDNAIASLGARLSAPIR